MKTKKIIALIISIIVVIGGILVVWFLNNNNSKKDNNIYSNNNSNLAKVEDIKETDDGLVFIKGGTFEMGSPENEAQRGKDLI